MKTLAILSLFIPAVLTAADSIYHEGWTDFNKNGMRDVFETPSEPIGKRVADLLAQMNLEEKTCQLATLYGYKRVLKDALPTPEWRNAVWKDGIANIDEQLNGVGEAHGTDYALMYPFSNHVKAINRIQRWFVEETRLGIPVDFSCEGLHGFCHVKATSAPAPIGVGSSWNRELVRKEGEVIGREGRLLGYTSASVPILDVVRDPRWGRCIECFGESPFLVAELGKAMTLGVQSQGFGTTLKHFAVHSVPKGGRDGSCRTDPHVAPRELHEIQLYPFRRVISETHPTGVLCSYNDWNGVPIAASRYFLTDLLRKTYGFDGSVLSDSGAVEFLQEKHGTVGCYEESVRQVLEAGLNNRIDFTPPDRYILTVRKLVREGKLAESVVDGLVADTLRVKFRYGLFDRPYVEDPSAADREVGQERHLALADALQNESMVLLRNTGILPLEKDKVRKVLVTGPLADETDYMTSRYGPRDNDDVSVLRGLREYLSGTAEVVYRKGCETVDRNWPDSEIVPTDLEPGEEAMLAEAVGAAEGADVIVAVLDTSEKITGECRSRTSLDLPGRQETLLRRLHAKGKPVVLVLVNGQPVTVNWADRNVAAILETWFGGSRVGVAVARTLFGEVNPSGRLNVTFPKSVGQIELNFPFKKGSHNDQTDEFAHTRVQGPLYPFGFGLSYTTFACANLSISPKKAGPRERRTVSCDVTNSGTRPGAEVVQLYVRDLESSVVTWDSVLRGFEKAFLEPGETKRVTFILEPQHLELLDRDMKWTVEPGDFEIRIGASSADIRLRDLLTVE